MPNTLLCPCCAAHLHVPEGLHVMRCNTCDAELTLVASGGVRGLVLLPPVQTRAPYAPGGIAPRTHEPFNGSELVFLRRRMLQAGAVRRYRIWRGVFLATVAALTATLLVGFIGANELFGDPRAHNETAALAFLGAFLSLPILGYIALYMQGRARLAVEEARKWSL